MNDPHKEVFWFLVHNLRNDIIIKFEYHFNFNSITF